jgi:hypothetical protein
MFDFYDSDIQNEHCHAKTIISRDGEPEQAFMLFTEGKPLVLTESEIQYMMDEVNKLKGG